MGRGIDGGPCHWHGPQQAQLNHQATHIDLANHVLCCGIPTCRFLTPLNVKAAEAQRESHLVVQVLTKD